MTGRPWFVPRPPTGPGLWHDPRSPYAELVWLPQLGPAAYALWRVLTELLERCPAGVTITLVQLAERVGIAGRDRGTARVRRALARLERFRLATPGGGGWWIRTAVAQLEPNQLHRLPPSVQSAYQCWQEHLEHRR